MRWVLAALPVLLTSACAFLLDFDELQAGNKSDAGGSAGASGQAGTGSSSGDAATPACATDCDDNEPCTTDSCDTSVSPPQCKHDAIAGVVSDGFSESIVVDTMHRVTMTAGADAFYLSAFETTNGTPELTVYRLGASADALESKIRLSTVGQFVNRPVRSAAGLVADTSSGLQLHAYFAIADIGGTSTRVLHVILNGNFEVTQLDQLAASYDATNPRRYPVADLVAGKVFGAWITSDGTIAGYIPGQTPLTFGDTSLPASQLAVVGSPTTPGVLWLGTSDGVYVQIAGSTRSQLTECTTEPGAYLSADSTFASLAGFWLVSWTKVGSSSLAAEGKGVFCDASGLCTGETGCGTNMMTPGARNAAFATATRSGDPAGTVFLAAAAPVLVADAGSGAEATLLLSTQRIDFGAVPFQSEPVVTTLGEAVTVSQMPTAAPGYEGPDWPAIAVIPPKIAVAWIEPDPLGNAMRVERFKMCIP